MTRDKGLLFQILSASAKEKRKKMLKMNDEVDRAATFYSCPFIDQRGVSKHYKNMVYLFFSKN